MQLDIEDKCIHQLNESHSEELSNEEIIELVSFNHDSNTEDSQENSKKFTASKLSEFFDSTENAFLLLQE